MSYSKRTCVDCGFRNIQPKMIQVERPVKTGKSQGSNLDWEPFSGTELHNAQSAAISSILRNATTIVSKKSGSVRTVQIQNEANNVRSET